MWWLFTMISRTPRTALAELESGPAFQEHLQRFAEALALDGRERAGGDTALASAGFDGAQRPEHT
ncbi:MAG TPA: hypothetical protein PL143_20760 [Rhodocyclaceae bacterium]|nr:hypothetical protein [Rhodocyclaceae bacterium]